jgi:hypothetical protein
LLDPFTGLTIGFTSSVNIIEMDTLSFDAINQAWNKLRTSGLGVMREKIPTLQDPNRLLMTRVSETPFMLTVMFRGFDQALADTERGVPLAKRFLMDWARGFGGEVQVQRGDDASLVLRIIKPSRNPIENPTTVESTEPSVRTGPLVHIAKVRRINDGY